MIECKIRQKWSIWSCCLIISSFRSTVYARYNGDASNGESRYNGDFLGDDYQKEFYEANLDMNTGDSDFPIDTNNGDWLY